MNRAPVPSKMIVPSPPINLTYTLYLASAAALGGLLFGFDIAIITGAGPFLTEHFGLSDLSLGIAFSSLLFGCVLGSAIAGRITDLYGRRQILLLVALLFALTSMATGLAPSFGFFLAVRFLGGIAVGGASILCPMYVSEISPPTIRGRLGALYQLSIILGIVISYSVNYLLRNTGPSNWRWMFISGVAPAALFLLLLLRAPETPRYLMMAGKEAEAYQILLRLVGSDRAIPEIRAIRNTLSVGKSRWRDLLQAEVRPAIMVGFCLAILIHFSGINTIIDYAPAIFKAAGWTIDSALFSTFVVGLTNLAFTVVSFWLIDRFGRKPLYVFGSLGMSITLLGLATICALGLFRGWLVLALIMAYLAFFAACIGPVFWTLIPEIFPNYLRGTAMAIPVLTQWVANAVVVLFFPLAFHRAGKALTFYCLAFAAIAQAAFTLFFVPETKNKSLEEIEQYWKTRAHGQNSEDGFRV